MPRQPRLDAPGALHHIMGRGIERTAIFRTDQDRQDFLNRLVDLCLETKESVLSVGDGEDGLSWWCQGCAFPWGDDFVG